MVQNLAVDNIVVAYSERLPQHKHQDLWGNLTLECYIVDSGDSHINHTNIGNAFFSDVQGLLSTLLTS